MALYNIRDLFKHVLLSKQLLSLAVWMCQLNFKWIATGVFLACDKVQDVSQQVTGLTKHTSHRHMLASVKSSITYASKLYMYGILQLTVTIMSFVS